MLDIFINRQWNSISVVTIPVFAINKRVAVTVNLLLSQARRRRKEGIVKPRRRSFLNISERATVAIGSPITAPSVASIDWVILDGYGRVWQSFLWHGFLLLVEQAQEKIIIGFGAVGDIDFVVLRTDREKA